MFELFKKREFVSYIARYRNRTVRGCIQLYSRTQRDCVQQLREYEWQVTGSLPESIKITARSPY